MHSMKNSLKFGLAGLFSGLSSLRNLEIVGSKCTEVVNKLCSPAAAGMGSGTSRQSVLQYLHSR